MKGLVKKNMEKYNMPLATEILREQVKRTRFWKAAFMVVLVVFMVSRITRKSGKV